MDPDKIKEPIAGNLEQEKTESDSSSYEYIQSESSRPHVPVARGTQLMEELQNAPNQAESDRINSEFNQLLALALPNADTSSRELVNEANLIFQRLDAEELATGRPVFPSEEEIEIFSRGRDAEIWIVNQSSLYRTPPQNPPKRKVLKRTVRPSDETCKPLQLQPKDDPNGGGGSGCGGFKGPNSGGFVLGGSSRMGAVEGQSPVQCSGNSLNSEKKETNLALQPSKKYKTYTTTKAPDPPIVYSGESGIATSYLLTSLYVFRFVNWIASLL